MNGVYSERVAEDQSVSVSEAMGGVTDRTQVNTDCQYIATLIQR